MRLRDLSEDYRSAVESGGKWYKVYELDPTNYKRDMKEAGNQTMTGRLQHGEKEELPAIRFIADGSDKSVYVFSDEVSHDEVMDKLHLSMKDSKGNQKQIMMGYAHQGVDGNWKFNGFSWFADKEGRGTYGNREDFYKKNQWVFLDKYISLPQKYFANQS